MSDLNKPLKENQQCAQTYLPHNCNAWNTIHYCSQGEPYARYSKCGYCGRILWFRFDSLLMRIRCLLKVTQDWIPKSYEE